MPYPLSVIEKTALQDSPNLVPSVRLLSKPGECSGSATLVNPCFCHPGDYCVHECIHLDDERLNISSGEDAFS